MSQKLLKKKAKKDYKYNNNLKIINNNNFLITMRNK